MASFTGMGTQDKKKVAIAGGLGVAVLALAIHTIFGGSPTSTPVPPPAESVPTLAGSAAAPARAAAANEASLDPRLHPELMAENENYLYNGNGRDIFAEEAGPPPSALNIEKVKGQVRPSMQMAANAGPAGPPPVDLKFFGYESPRNGGPRRAFLLNGDNVFVAGVGDVVSHRYRVVQIAPTSIQVEDLPYRDTQTLPLIRN